ncbi:hypothetical protein L596_002449 [Steinernema carpocapsae]|uniref:Uncharacterized protein n=1 Tax=Steinernema carpocapsae TaxID=34508 RepID=A0A4U8UPM7_STECR|nr:hypothetical protein L596_002449 [Steinernema carpocapsae]
MSETMSPRRRVCCQFELIKGSTAMVRTKAAPALLRAMRTSRKWINAKQFALLKGKCDFCVLVGGGQEKATKSEQHDNGV